MTKKDRPPVTKSDRIIIGTTTFFGIFPFMRLAINGWFDLIFYFCALFVLLLLLALTIRQRRKALFPSIAVMLCLLLVVGAVNLHSYRILTFADMQARGVRSEIPTDNVQLSRSSDAYDDVSSYITLDAQDLESLMSFISTLSFKRTLVNDPPISQGFCGISFKDEEDRTVLVMSIYEDGFVSSSWKENLYVFNYGRFYSLFAAESSSGQSFFQVVKDIYERSLQQGKP
ncbi:MAG: hypothetical protein FWG42_02540 [Clostridiales bacterium]|nr:hypothetical protein [Clostridiales bacterium]